MEAEVEEATEVDHHQDLVVDIVEGLVLVDQAEATEVDHLQVVLADMMARAVRVDLVVDTHLLVVMTMEVEEATEVDHHQVLVVATRVDLEAALDIVVLRVEAMEVTHSVIALALLDTASHDHLSLEEMHLTMHTLSEVNKPFITKENSERSSLFVI